jgi:hypothetical protein
MSGEIDYLLRVVVPDIAAYDAVYKRLIAGTHLFDVSSSFAMEEIKFTTALPLSYRLNNAGKRVHRAMTSPHSCDRHSAHFFRAT